MKQWIEFIIGICSFTLFDFFAIQIILLYALCCKRGTIICIPVKSFFQTNRQLAGPAACWLTFLTNLQSTGCRSGQPGSERATIKGSAGPAVPTEQ